MVPNALTTGDVETLDELYRVLARNHYGPLWTIEGALTPESATGTVPHLWNYEEVRALIVRAADLIPAEGAERPVPSLKDLRAVDHEIARATETLWAAVQMVVAVDHPAVCSG